MAILQVAGVLFLLMGVGAFILQTGIDLPLDLTKAEVLFGYATAVGSVIGGLFLLFKKSGHSGSSIPAMPSSPSLPKIK